VILLSCNQNEKHNEKNDEGSNTYPINKESEQIVSEDFSIFLSKFQRDSLFRVDRTKFPLEGFNSDEKEVGSTDTLFIWTKPEFLFYSNEDFGSKSEDAIDNEIINKGERKIFRMYKKESGYDVSYHFENINGEWFLEYYSYKNY
jgi:hypothetical protein